jgi:D-apionolactonase
MLTERVLWYGEDEPLPERIALRAGPLRLFWENGDLRYIRLGEHEVLRRIYVAIRDRNWGTVPNALSDVAVEVGEQSFRITFQVENRLDEIHFTWRGAIAGAADGTLTLSMDGTAQSTFLKNRIGFCILHPATSAGAGAKVWHVDGSSENAVLPRFLVPDQPVAPFADMRGLAHELCPGLWAELAFAGDVFEMEDQRNWTDASYKTFSTPLRIPYPVEVPAGTRIYQSLTLTLHDRRPAAAVRAPAEGQAPVFTVDRDAVLLPLPPLGLGMASHGQELSESEAERLAALGISHLRVDLPLADAVWPARLHQAQRAAERLGAQLEVALIVDPARAGVQAEGLAPALQGGIVPHTRVARWLVLAVPELFRGGTALREVLEPVGTVLAGLTPAPIVSGSNHDFIFLARSLPPPELVDGLTFAITPQVHAFDNASIVETAGTQGQAVASARAFAGDKPVFVSPITLKMRQNPYATGPVPPTPPGRLPPQADARQMSLFAAGWTAASLKHVAEAGAAGVTYYETTGWRGVMETLAGSPLPAQFASIPGGAFPVYHVLADVGEFSGGQVIPSRSSDSLAVDGLALRKAGRARVVLANLTGEQQAASVRGLPDEVQVRLLDSGNAEEAMRAPEAYRAVPGSARVTNQGELRLLLPPFAVARLDGQTA